jgi:hypothetical protein
MTAAECEAFDVLTPLTSAVLPHPRPPSIAALGKERISARNDRLFSLP